MKPLAILLKSASAMLVLACSLPGPAQNLIQNGSFEMPMVPVPMDYEQFFVGVPPFIPNWSVVTNQGEMVLILNSSYTVPGLQFPSEDQYQWLDLTGSGSNTPTTGVQQTVTTMTGHTYQLSYWVGNISAGGAYGTTSTVKVSINGTPTFMDTNSMV